RWLTQSSGTILACASAGGSYTFRFGVGAFAVNRVFTIGNGRIIAVPASGGEHQIRTRIPLRTGWQFLRIRLLGSEPIRPSDVIPGEPDSRPLAVSISPMSVSGARASPAHCRRAPRPDDIATVGPEPRGSSDARRRRRN